MKGYELTFENLKELMMVLSENKPENRGKFVAMVRSMNITDPNNLGGRPHSNDVLDLVDDFYTGRPKENIMNIREVFAFLEKYNIISLVKVNDTWIATERYGSETTYSAVEEDIEKLNG